MTTIERIQEWYSRQCNGEWEHRYGVKVDSCDNPGWWVKIDLVGTGLEHAPFARVAHGVDEAGFATESDWIDCKVKEGIFDGAGDAGKLETIFTMFLDWKDRCEQQSGGYSPSAARSSKPTP